MTLLFSSSCELAALASDCSTPPCSMMSTPESESLSAAEPSWPFPPRLESLLAEPPWPFPPPSALLPRPLPVPPPRFARVFFPPRRAFALGPFPPRPPCFVGGLHSADTVAVGARGLEYVSLFKNISSADLVNAGSALLEVPPSTRRSGCRGANAKLGSSR